MNLTDEQWRLIEPILPPPSPADRGRPPIDRRAVLDGILWKIRTDNPWYDWWLANSVLAVAEKHQNKPSHANWLEAFPFTVVGELPDEEKVPPRVPVIMDAEEARRVYGDGSFGGRYQVEGSIMQEVFAAALLDILQLLKFE